MVDSNLYYFFTVGCGWCTRAMPHVDELNKDGHNILKLDLEDSDNKAIENELKEKYNISCGTPLFINAKTGHHVCGYREKDILLKWINGEEVPAPPSSKNPMPRVPFHAAAKKEINKWKREYNKWADDNSHLPNIKTVDQLLALPRVKSTPPPPPMPTATEEQIGVWKKKHALWVKDNKHLKNLPTADQVLHRIQQQRVRQLQQNTKDISLDEKVKSIELKLDRLMAHLGVK